MGSPLTVASSISEIRSIWRDCRANGKTIGIVPTMGALHEGHLSLMRAARPECDLLVTTLFVNPTQFAPGEDFEKYPRPLERDLDLCRAEAVDVVFTPTPDVMYPAGHQTHVTVEQLSRPWEGAHRPSHFRGVTTVVLKLLNIVQPDIAFFGQKDFQQQLLIRQMCRDLNVPTRIQTCATVREPDGLALSSRNAYLSSEERKQAAKLASALQLGLNQLADGKTHLPGIREQMKQHLEAETEFQTDYITIVDAQTLEEPDSPTDQMVAIGAASLGTTRLIDNLLVPPLTLETLNSI
ncbi:MAG: pantoate--beta-alanine ligase [Planctomycetaceae bacterium]|nr:pantoate--beta-alanine ligase [Planctomycetaceae bacterium]